MAAMIGARISAVLSDGAVFLLTWRHVLRLGTARGREHPSLKYAVLKYGNISFVMARNSAYCNFTARHERY